MTKMGKANAAPMPNRMSDWIKLTTTCVRIYTEKNTDRHTDRQVRIQRETNAKHQKTHNVKDSRPKQTNTYTDFRLIITYPSGPVSGAGERGAIEGVAQPLLFLVQKRGDELDEDNHRAGEPQLQTGKHA